MEVQRTGQQQADLYLPPWNAEKKSHRINGKSLFHKEWMNAMKRVIRLGWFITMIKQFLKSDYPWNYFFTLMLHLGLISMKVLKVLSAKVEW